MYNAEIEAFSAQTQRAPVATKAKALGYIMNGVREMIPIPYMNGKIAILRR